MTNTANDDEIEAQNFIIKTFLVLWSVCFFEMFIVRGFAIDQQPSGFISFSVSMVIICMIWSRL